MDQYLNLDIPKGGVIASVKLDDEGVVIDILDVRGEVIASTWKLYSEFGKVVENEDTDRASVSTLLSRLPETERCPICGQPDNTGDCDHTPIPEDQLLALLAGEADR